MSYGIQVQNSSGDIVIDQDFRNFEVVQAGSVSGGGGLFTVNYPTCETPMLFVRAVPGSQVMGGRVSYTEARWVMTGVTSCDYIIASVRTNNALSASHGLAVYDQGGRVVFDSGRQYIKTFTSVTIPPNTPENGVVWHDSEPFTSYMSVQFLGVRDMFCNLIFPHAIQRTTTNSITMRVWYAHVSDPEIPHIFGSGFGDVGGGYYRHSPRIPILFARL